MIRFIHMIKYEPDSKPLIIALLLELKIDCIIAHDDTDAQNAVDLLAWIPELGIVIPETFTGVIPDGTRFYQYEYCEIQYDLEQIAIYVGRSCYKR